MKSIRFNVHIQSKLLYHTPVMGTQSRYQLGCVTRTVVTLLEVSEKEDGVEALHLPKGQIKKPLCDGAGSEIRTQYIPAH